MKGIVSNHLSNRRMPTGRHVFAFQQILKNARARGVTEVVEWLEKCVAQGRKTLRVEFSYEQTRDNHSSARGRAAQLDNQLDGQIAAIKKLVEARETGDDGDPIVKASRTVQNVVFPRGVSAIIHQEFEVQLGMMDVMIEQFNKDLSEEVSLLGIGREVSRLERLVEEFRAELTHTGAPITSYDQVIAAREELHEYSSMAEILILAAFPGLDEEATRKRESLLAPLTDQQERVAEIQRRRRRLRDVDPDTGDELVDDVIVGDDEQPAGEDVVDTDTTGDEVVTEE